ncbi:MAG: hypothetical protein M3378_02440 [Actinomycetota bacterium]|nr:hypothetical protein [Actinomycetota bacterium]
MSSEGRSPRKALAASQILDRSESPELWLDYVADLGDGWNSTYTVSRLLASEDLEVGWNGHDHATERGRPLVMGGDQVYPVPKRTEYVNRLLGPYRAAMPCAAGEPRELFAIPGSHDWYDGLINFEEVFCRQRSIGGWKTQQTRSYFAISCRTAGGCGVSTSSSALHGRDPVEVLLRGRHQPGGAR